MGRHWRSDLREPSAASELLPLAWCSCIGGLIACGVFLLARDPGFALLAAVVALCGAVGVAALVGRR